jgi:hypothetical protein
MGNANTTVADATQATSNTQQASETPASWEEFLETQPEEVKALYGTHSEALLNTVKATRDERDTFKKQVKELASKAEKGSELEKSLTDMTARLEAAERRAAFLEEAAKPEVQCRNTRAAWLLAEASDLFDKKGNPDWAAIKREAPELFGTPVANANAGNNTQQAPSPHQNMNSFIRKAAGRS